MADHDPTVPARKVTARTAAELLDRLLYHNNIVATDGESYRMREARTRTGGRPTKP